MTGFSADWLALREPYDHAARDKNLLRQAIGVISKYDCPTIVDLASGAGSTVRAMASLLNSNANWHLVDDDAVLLAHAQSELSDTNISLHKIDLSTSLGQAFEIKPDMMTTSAFLDLVTADWLEQLVDFCATYKVPFYAALSYDGRVTTSPDVENEAGVLAAFHLHQTTDKGFGAALGPKGADYAIELFRKAGFSVTSAKSDWMTGPRDFKFQSELFIGWHRAACEIDPARKAEFDNWLDRRLALTEQSSLTVGHVDFLATPI